MNKNILVVNAGSSSIKFRIYDINMNEIASALCERIGVDGYFKLSPSNGNTFEENANFENHDLAIDYFIKKIIELRVIDSLESICGIGHRVVQGGEVTSSVLIDQSQLQNIYNNIKLAPLHNKPEYDVISILMEKIPGAKNVAVFDTSFHTSIPKVNSYYAVPKTWLQSLPIKRYGFHGTSYRYILEKMREVLNTDKPLNLIVCHLGNGASICCIKKDKSYDTTMGLTPLAGLVMGTRSGDIDPSICQFVAENLNLSINEISNQLNKESGLKAICGSSDFRDITSNAVEGNDYDFARDIFVQKVANYVAQYANHLEGNIDAIVFTGGIGENSFDVRQRICDRLGLLKLSIDREKNLEKYDDYKKINNLTSRVKVYAVRTNEELKIAQDTKKLAGL